MKKYAILFSLTFISGAGSAMDYREVCKMRAALMGSIAVDRDAGKTQKQVKDTLKKIFGKNLPAASDIYVETVYKFPNISPEKFADVTLRVANTTSSQAPAKQLGSLPSWHDVP